MMCSRLMPLVVLIAFLVSGCNRSSSESSKYTAEDIEAALRKGFSQLWQDPNLPIKEVEKLQQREYSVFTLPVDSDAKQIEKTLNELGKNRWDCFAIEKITSSAPDKTDSLMFICKRMPETLLRFVPHSIIGR